MAEQTPDSALIADDAAKLRTLADWFDVKDDARGCDDREVQRDLRRIANRLEAAEQENALLRESEREWEDEYTRDVKRVVAQRDAALARCRELQQRLDRFLASPS